MISETDLMWWCSLHKCKALSDVKSVCDIGLQELTCTRQDVFDLTAPKFVELCGEPNVDLSDCRSSADMWRRLKREIVSLDVTGNEMSLVHFDLNTDRVPPALQSHFDFVNNAGTTEHVFNQMNCFSVIHDLTKVQGLMVHASPFAGFENHGFYKYSWKFYTRLAKANDYDCLDAWVSMDLDAAQLKLDVVEFLMDDVKMFRNARSSGHHPVDFFRLKLDDYRTVDACIYVALRKTKKAEFKIPEDLSDI
jgi:hypothetical protein